MQETPGTLSRACSRPDYIASTFLFLTIVVAGAEPVADSDELPRIPATPPEKALETFRNRPGIALDLVAHEPLVEDPASIAFDAAGRLFAVEMRGYSERRDDALGQIRLLHDDDDDGFFDRSTIYAKGLKWPTGLVCSHGGIYVIATPDLIWFRDSDGDGVADEKKIVFTGFGEGSRKLNVQGLPNSLKWGPDNRIWGSGGTVGGRIRKSDSPSDKPVSLAGTDFSFDPKTLDFRAENGRAQYGLSFDSSGRRFASSNSVHIMAVMWEKSWTRPNPHFSLPKPFVSIASDGGAAPVFRISPDEPWRIVRTRWRVAGVVKGIVEGGGRVSGYFTGASGITIYTGDALGQEYVGNAFIGDVGSNLVHRKIISRRDGGVGLRADRAKDERGLEFIASTDNWFRPTTYSNAPDGCLYISDMYREVIEHPWSLPDGIKTYLDLNSGNDRGRIYRVRPEIFHRRPTGNLREFSNDQLTRLLAHPNGWHRTTAQRLLWERGDERAGPGWAKERDSPFRLALSLARENTEGKTEMLFELMEAHSDDTWMVSAIINALHGPAEAGELFSLLSVSGLEGKPYLFPLAECIGRMNHRDTTEVVLSTTAENTGHPATVMLLESLAIGLQSSGSSLKQADQSGRLEPVFKSAMKRATNETASTNSRISAIRLLAFSPDESADKVLESILSSPGNGNFYATALQALDKRGSKSLPETLIENWDLYPTAIQSSVLGTLVRKPSTSLLLLSAIRNRRVPKAALTPNLIALLRNYEDREIRTSMAQQFPVTKITTRSEVIATYRESTKLNGDPDRGLAIFRNACASCHRNGDEGHAVGPDLVSFKAAGAESIISNLFDPNKEVAPQFQTYLFTLKNGERILGIIGHETTTEVTVKMPFGLDKRFPRAQVATMKATGKSLMPEGLESALSLQNVADLLAFLLEK